MLISNLAKGLVTLLRYIDQPICGRDAENKSTFTIRRVGREWRGTITRLDIEHYSVVDWSWTRAARHLLLEGLDPNTTTRCHVQLVEIRNSIDTH